MNKRFQTPSPLAEILENFFGRAGMKRRLAEQRILDSWKRIVGKGIAEQTQPLRVQNGILQVRVSSSVWMQQLQFMKGMILQKVKEETGALGLEDLRFFLGEVPGEGFWVGGGESPEGDKAETGENLTESEKERIRKEVAKLTDPEMKRVFESVFSRGLVIEKAARLERKGKEK